MIFIVLVVFTARCSVFGVVALLELLRVRVTNSQLTYISLVLITFTVIDVHIFVLSIRYLGSDINLKFVRIVFWTESAVASTSRRITPNIMSSLSTFIHDTFSCYETASL